MELRQLRYLVAVTRHGQFSRAARAVGIAPSSLFEQIGVLERELEVRLVQRAHRGVQLTSAGQALLPHALNILEEIERARAAIEPFASRENTVVIGTVSTADRAHLTTALAEFHLKFPAIQIVLREESNARLLELLRQGDIDLAMATFAGVGESLVPPDLSAEASLAEEMVAVVTNSHPLAALERVSISSLRNQGFILSGGDSVVRQAIVYESKQAGFVPTISLECTSWASARQLAARGLGVAIVPLRIARQRKSPRVHILRLEPGPLRLQVALVTLAGRPYGNAVAALVEYTRKHLRLSGKAGLPSHTALNA